MDKINVLKIKLDAKERDLEKLAGSKCQGEQSHRADPFSTYSTPTTSKPMDYLHSCSLYCSIQNPVHYNSIGLKDRIQRLSLRLLELSG